MPNTLATSLRPWLSLRGKTSPAPGEDVTVGDKRGNLARERLRGSQKTKRTSSEEPVRHGRGSKFRTHGTRFWRPLLYQLSYTPIYIR